MRCTLPGEVIEEDVLAIFVGNEKSLGGDFVPCPNARIDDGKLDICLVRAAPSESYLRLFAKVSRGEHVALTDSVVYRQSEGPVTLELSRKSPFLADGDLWLSSERYELTVAPEQLELLIG